MFKSPKENFDYFAKLIIVSNIEKEIILLECSDLEYRSSQNL